MRLVLLTNATVVDDAIRFVSQKSKDKEKIIHILLAIAMKMTSKRNQKNLTTTMMKIS
jgi:hypothetical protein